MSARRIVLACAAAVASAALLGACGEKPQTIGTGVRADSAAFQGVNTPFTAAGWKQGDRTSWEQQLRTRAQNTQNEYAKAN